MATLTLLKPKRMEELGLGDYLPYMPHENITRLIERAISNGKWTGYLWLLERHFRNAVWCKSEIGVGFSSAGYPAEPGHIFLTPLVFVHLPPNIRLPAISAYAVLENLIHESIHLELGEQLGSTLTFGAEPCIEVPWRNTKWTIEHALHAYLVYKHIFALRFKAIDGNYLDDTTAQSLIAEMPAVREILKLLKEQLDKYCPELLEIDLLKN